MYFVFQGLKLIVFALQLKFSREIAEADTKGVLKKFANITGKHLCWSLFFLIGEIFKSTYFEDKIN